MDTTLLKSVKIERLTESNYKEAFELVTEIFATSSVLHNAVGLEVDVYRTHMHDWFKYVSEQNLSIVAIDTQSDTVVGCLLACDYASANQFSQATPDKLKSINAILAALDDIYRTSRQIRPGECLLVDMAAVTASATGRGIYRALRERIHDMARAAGFRKVIGELSSTVTQQLCIKQFRHTVMAEIEYQSFRYNGVEPFASIQNPKSIILVEGDLTQ